MGTVATVSIGTVDYDVYALTSDALGDANAYHKGSLGTTSWDDADNNTRKKALITATRMLDRARWSGAKQGDPQATQWPRTGATCYGEIVADGTPDAIAHGTFALALALLEDESIQDKRTTRTDIRSVAAGSAQVEFFQPLPGEETRFPTVVQELVGCFLAGIFPVAGLPYASGTDEDSSFGEDDFERSEGFA